MAHFYLCWELGAGLGHAARLKSIGQALRARGHRISYVLRDLVQPHSLLWDEGAALLQAPIWLHRTGGLPQVPASLAEILLTLGYLEADALAGLCAGWRGLLQQGRPDLVIADYAPSAILAAKSLGLPAVAVGAGFQIPPAGQPLPAFQPGLPEPRLRASEARVLDSANRVLARHGAAPLAHACELLRGDAALLCSWPELDHYGRSGDGPWLGPSLAVAPAHAHDAAWPDGAGARVFAYLKMTHPCVSDVLEALLRRGCRVLCYMPEVAGGAPAPVDSALLRYAARPLSLAQVLPDCDLVACHAGEATTAQALLAGKPLLLLPAAMESHLMARRVAQLGAGIDALAPPRDRDGAVRALLDTPGYRDAARAFAGRHAGFDGVRQAGALADRVEQVLLRRP